MGRACFGYAWSTTCSLRSYNHASIYSCLHIYTCTRLNLELSIFYALATACIFSTLSVIFSFLTVFLLHTAMMASFNKGQLPAQQTKVVDHGLGPLKAGPTRLCVPVCNHDAASSKPSSVGRDVVDIINKPSVIVL